MSVKKKKCSDCEKVFEINYNNFYKSPTNKTGFTAKCKHCFDLAKPVRKKFKHKDEHHDGSCWMNGQDELYI